MHITQHAVLRYLERVCGFSVDGIEGDEAAILHTLLELHDLSYRQVFEDMVPVRVALQIEALKTGTFPVNGQYKLVVRNCTVITIYLPEFGAPTRKYGTPKYLKGRAEIKGKRPILRYRWRDYQEQSPDEPEPG